MTRVPTLSDGVVTLRGHREDDLPGVVEQCTDPEMQAWTTVPVPYTLDDAKTYVRHLVPGGWEADVDWSFAVTADDDGTERFAGGVGLLHRGDGLAELGYGTSPWARRRGLTERACRLLLTWGFEERGLQAVEWVAKRRNWPSRRLAWRLGFDVGAERAWMHQRGALVPAWRGTLARGEALAPRRPWYDAPVLRGDHVLLRPVADADAAGIAATQSDDRTRWFSEGPRSRRPDLGRDGLPFAETFREVAARGEGVAWSITDPTDGAYLGHVELNVRHLREADLGFMAHPAARGRGLTSEAARLALRHAFVPEADGGLGLRRVQAWSASTNEASRRLLRGLGMREGGRTRSEVLLADGSWDDEVVHDLLAEEWAPSGDGPSGRRPAR